jgi:glycerol-3-phosphate dehydrogenase subunit B
MLVVGFRSLTGFDARMVADRIASVGVPFDVHGAEVAFAESFRADAKITRLARALDHDEPIDGTPARRALVDAVASRLGDAERVGFPAFLGDDAADEVRDDLADRLGTDVFEIPMGPPSIPGLRLEDRLFEALDAEGVRFETGNPVVGFESSGDRVETVLVDRQGREVPYGADAFVLAAGGLVGKGLTSDRERVREPVFGCHVPQPDDRYGWFVDDAFGDQPYARFGLSADGAMRPLDENGRPEFVNLHTAGAVVGGADVAREKSASGVSLATGVVAGRHAATDREAVSPTDTTERSF